MKSATRDTAADIYDLRFGATSVIQTGATEGVSEVSSQLKRASLARRLMSDGNDGTEQRVLQRRWRCCELATMNVNGVVHRRRVGIDGPKAQLRRLKAPLLPPLLHPVLHLEGVPAQRSLVKASEEALQGDVDDLHVRRAQKRELL